MPTFDPSDLIGRTFFLLPEENGERHRAKVTRQVVEIIDQDNGQTIQNIHFILDIGNGKVEELISYNQLLEHLENAQDHGDTFLTKIPIAPCYCQMMGRTLKEEIKITQYNNTTKAGKYSLEDLLRASDNIPHHYPKF